MSFNMPDTWDGYDFHKTGASPHTLIVLFGGITGSLAPLKLHCLSKEHAKEVHNEISDTVDSCSCIDFTILKGHL